MQSDALSAATFRVGDGRRVLVDNPLHSPGGTRSNLAHELANIALGHTLRTVETLAELSFVTCDVEQEEEADWLARNGRTIKILNAIDEFTREALVAETDRSIDADHVVFVLDKIAGQRGFPKHLRFDNGPEFEAFAVADWCRFNEAETIFIDPGSPWQNAWVECYNGRIRDEHLNGQLFDTLLEAQVLNEAWRVDYNENRPYSARGWKVPAAFAAEWSITYQPSLA